MLLEDQRNARNKRYAFSEWRAQAQSVMMQNLTADTSGQLKKMQTEREQYFADERRKYEDIITGLKTELSGFAVKERKMKDAMKQAFLKGINAISEQATCALDRADRVGMPAPLQRELEDKYPGDKDQVDVFSDGEVQEFQGYDVADMDVSETVAAGESNF